MKRAVDVAVAALALLAALPLIAVAAAGMRLSSPGPVLYRAPRLGRGGRPFAMIKLRSMHVAGGAAITARDDPRVFRFGRLIRRLKIDELPQFVNVLRGEMSIVGPRPEDPGIVAAAYVPWMMETLAVRPGITSPGALFHYAACERLVDPADPEGSYLARVLAPKLAVDRAYLERATVASDLGVMLRTAASVAGAAVGRPVNAARRDRLAARRWCPADSFPQPDAAAAPAPVMP